MYGIATNCEKRTEIKAMKKLEEYDFDKMYHKCGQSNVLWEKIKRVRVKLAFLKTPRGDDRRVKFHIFNLSLFRIHYKESNLVDF